MDVDQDRLVDALRQAGAVFAFVFGSRAEGHATDASDLDVGAWFGGRSPAAWDVAATLPSGVDLLVLDDAPLELAGRVALRGQLLFDDDPSARVAWQAETRKIYLDEKPRIERSRQDALAAMIDRG